MLKYNKTNDGGLMIAESRVQARRGMRYPGYAGRGIVIVGGGKYWPSVYVSVRMLRYVGCELPIQVWHLTRETDLYYEALLATQGVECIDAQKQPYPNRGLAGFRDPTERNGPLHPPFELKSYAAMHSPYEEVLLLDADNYPCTDPTVLFEDERYKQTGAIFWPDVKQTASWTRWKDWGVQEYGPKCGLEVGQYVINKKLAWEPFSLMRWYDDHGDWCYGWGIHHDHGDKGPPRVAWAMFKRDYTMFSAEVVWKEFAFVQPGPDGVTPMFIHRCKSKFVLKDTVFESTPQKSANRRADLPLEDVAFGYLAELK